ncbi:hypothetical protein CIL05_11390 [Virgibacillus profundi]|uniref:DUF1798 domain-containing protein n=1 Tax=Virgibacillus profundi TaxID=2024555 RepID=A0A2A2ID05_9BACI|nr:DUF1798 family protein [Virgibacillus profundi]PAV29462.1 hypothetical protein CIL05_11390 [Virgibacillus profundi]PXY53631.1 DUF1798 domain-containing protein [Virgibacillus profundi]
MDLKSKTKQLKQHLNNLKEIYESNNPPKDRKDKQFFRMVKEETSPIYQLLGLWEEAVLEVVKERKVNLHPQQVTSTRENMELLLMHSYYIDVKRKRYMELNNSIHYIFDQLLREL